MQPFLLANFFFFAEELRKATVSNIHVTLFNSIAIGVKTLGFKIMLEI